MTSLPVITLVTPSFNQAEFLERTIQSVVAQEYPALDWIIVDAMSTDGTKEILDRYRELPFLRIIREPDHGQTDAINKGLRVGRGEIAGWLNSDDELLPGALRAIGEAFARNERAVLVYGGGRKIDTRGSLLKKISAKPFDRRLLRTAFYILQPSMFFRRELAVKLGGLDESLHYVMDWELALRLAEAGEVVRIDAELSALRCYPGTKTEAGGWKRFAEIAAVGRKFNGPFDRNFLAYHARRIAAPFPWARRVVDFVGWKLFADRSLMVVGWPAEARES